MALLDSLALHSHRYWMERGEEIQVQVGPVSPTLSTSSASMSSSSSTAGESVSSASPSPPATTPEKSNRSRKPYRMASNFELSDEQPMAVQQRRPRDKGDSYNALFGPAPSRGRQQRSVSLAPPSTIQRRSRKPLPVNPLTGETLGLGGGLELPPQPAACAQNNTGFTRFKRPPPGGFTSQLW